MNRLASAQTASGPTQWGQSYNYDGFGNLTDQNVILGSAPSMHVTYNPATNRQYSDTADANGNLGGYAFDVANRLVPATNPVWIGGAVYTSALYTYDAQNHRVFRTDANGNTYFTFWGANGQKLAEYTWNASYCYCFTQTRTWAYFGGKLVYDSGLPGNGYVNADRLASVGKFYPYGQERPSATTNDTEKFTGYFRDSATGLDYANQRYHQPGMGRFMTADPYQASAGPADPGSFNRYAYTRGDPVNRTDARGTCDDSADAFTSCGGGGYDAGGCDWNSEACAAEEGTVAEGYCASIGLAMAYSSATGTCFPPTPSAPVIPVASGSCSVLPKNPSNMVEAVESALDCFGLSQFIFVATYAPTANGGGVLFTISNVQGFEAWLNQGGSAYPYFGSDPWYAFHVHDVCSGNWFSCVFSGDIESWRSFINKSIGLFGSLQIVIDSATGAGYADIDACNTQDLKNIGCHLGGMIWGGITGIVGPRPRGPIATPRISPGPN